MRKVTRRSHQYKPYQPVTFTRTSFLFTFPTDFFIAALEWQEKLKDSRRRWRTRQLCTKTKSAAGLEQIGSSAAV
jgi:hypothetical protein